MRAHFGSRPLPLTRKLLHKRRTHSRPHSVLQTRSHTHTHPHTYTFAHKNARVHGKRAHTHTPVQTHIHSKNKTSPCALNPHVHVHIQTHPLTFSSTPLPQAPPTHDLRYPQSQIIISARAARVGHTHARTRALPSPHKLGRLRPGSRFGFQVWWRLHAPRFAVRRGVGGEARKGAGITKASWGERKGAQPRSGRGGSLGRPGLWRLQGLGRLKPEMGREGGGRGAGPKRDVREQ